MAYTYQFTPRSNYPEENKIDPWNGLNERFGVQCETCKAVAPTRAQLKHKAIVPMPDIDELMEAEWEDGGCEATDGCWVEPDGICEHGHKSWMLIMGVI